MDNYNRALTKAIDLDLNRCAEMKVLLVDDDANLVEFLRHFLEGLKFRVETASSGEEALSILHNIGDVDIALIDYWLPGMNGLETIGRISESSPDTIMMVITGLPTLDSSIRAIRLGASDYILKPFKVEDLVASIKKAMKEREIRLEIRKLKSRVAALEKDTKSLKNIEVNDNIERIGNIQESSKTKPPD